MNNEEFFNLYKRQKVDESLTPFNNEIGFSLVRTYPQDTKFYKDDLRMFIKVALLDKGFFYSVDMTKHDQQDEGTDHYIIVDSSPYGSGVTNFVANLNEQEFSFDEKEKKIVHLKTNKKLTVNEFVDILVKNHMSDCLFWKRKKNYIVNKILKLIFWLSDKHYERLKVAIDKYHFSRDNTKSFEDKISIEPFFKYFLISKNMIFALSFIAFALSILYPLYRCILPIKNVWIYFFGEPSLSNPLVVVFIFLILFMAEKISIYLNKEIKDFFIPIDRSLEKTEKNFIEKLHDYLHKNSFELKL